jgi:hypothetical protein
VVTLAEGSGTAHWFTGEIDGDDDQLRRQQHGE